MTVMECPGCKKEISDAYTFCPFCGQACTKQTVDSNAGAESSTKKKSKGWKIGCGCLTILLLGITFLGILGHSSSSTSELKNRKQQKQKETRNNELANEAVKQKQKEARNNELENEMVKQENVKKLWENYKSLVEQAAAEYSSHPEVAYKKLRKADELFDEIESTQSNQKDNQTKYSRRQDHLEMLGGLYLTGEGVDTGKDIPKAIDYFGRINNELSQYILALIYYFGVEGVPQDKIKAGLYFGNFVKHPGIPTKFVRRAVWFITEIAIETNLSVNLLEFCETKLSSENELEKHIFSRFPKSMEAFLLPDIPPGDNPELFSLLLMSKILKSSLSPAVVCSLWEKPGCAEAPIPFEEECQAAAKSGDVDSMVTMGMILQKKENPKAAAAYYTKAANKKNPVALRKLGLMHMKGEGVQKNTAKAIKYYKQAAELNDYAAAYNLGNIYLYAKGVSRDLEAAEEWFQLAKDNGSEDAEKGLEEIKGIRIKAEIERMTKELEMKQRQQEKEQQELYWRNIIKPQAIKTVEGMYNCSDLDLNDSELRYFSSEEDLTGYLRFACRHLSRDADYLICKVSVSGINIRTYCERDPNGEGYDDVGCGH